MWVRFPKPLMRGDTGTVRLSYHGDLIGFGSLPIVLAACFFTGAALALNSATTLTRFGALTLV